MCVNVFVNGWTDWIPLLYHMHDISQLVYLSDTVSLLCFLIVQLFDVISYFEICKIKITNSSRVENSENELHPPNLKCEFQIPYCCHHRGCSSL